MSALDDANAADAALTNAIAGPAEVSGDAGSVRQHSLPDLIAAELHQAARAAAASRTRGLRFNPLVPDGTASRRHYGDSGSGFGFGPRQDF